LFDTFGVSSERNFQKNQEVLSIKSMPYGKEVVGLNERFRPLETG